VCGKAYHGRNFKICSGCWKRKKYNLTLEEPFPGCIHENEYGICDHFEVLADYGEYITCNQEEKVSEPF
jgi:hypothetical protein